MLHSGIVFTHEAKIRELLEDEEDDFLDEGIRALEISGSSTTTHESLEIAPGEFYGSRRWDQEKPSTPPPRPEDDPFSEEHAVETEDDQEAKKKGEPPEKAEVHDDKNDGTTTIA